MQCARSRTRRVVDGLVGELSASCPRHIDWIRQRGRLPSARALTYEALHRLADQGALRVRQAEFAENRIHDRIAAEDPVPKLVSSAESRWIP